MDRGAVPRRQVTRGAQSRTTETPPDPDPPDRLTHPSGEQPRPSWKRQTVISSALVFLTAVLGIWTQAVLAATLGLSGEADAYFTALALSLFVTYILTQTVINRWVPELASLLDPMHLPTRAFW